MISRLRRLFLFVPPGAATILVVLTLRHHDWNEPFFVYSAYYAMFALIGVYLGVYAYSLCDLPAIRTSVRENAAGIALTALVALVVFRSVPAAYRVLADEANLVGVSKNLFFHRTANFAVTGKWYFENYWNLNETTDRRPALFPFLVSLVHAVRGYHAENGFVLNAALFVAFVFSAYRLAKCLGGELFGLTTALLVATNPNTLVGARSAGFDFLFTFVLLIVVQSFYDYATEPTPPRLAIFVLSLCLVAHVRYECWALMGVALVVLFGFGTVRRDQLRGFGWVYSMAPLLVVPRYWQAVAKADDAEQPLSASLFSLHGFRENTMGYLRVALHPLDLDGPHSPLLLILGILGIVCAAVAIVRMAARRGILSPQMHVAAFIVAILATESVICFSYVWGKPIQPASARLFIWLDTAVAFGAAWLITIAARRFALPFAPMGRRSGAPMALLVCGALFAMHIPAASEARFINALILTRDAAQAWQFFAKLDEKRILVLADRPGLFTIMDYGALDISSAGTDRGPLLELSRGLYKDVYLVQNIDLDSGKPSTGYASWPDVTLETALEFQSTESAAIRIARVKHSDRIGMP